MGKEVKKEAFVSIYDTVKDKVSAFCQMFKLARSTFYRWKKQGHQPKRQGLIDLIHRFVRHTNIRMVIVKLRLYCEKK